MRRGVAVLLAATLLVALVLTLWPGLDLRVSAAFYDAATGRWFASGTALETLRSLIWWLGESAIVAALLLFVLALARRGSAQVPARLWGFAFAAFALGPGLLVNVILKDHWGRARPRMLSEFGGEATFTPALQLADQCVRNCSFVSGEVSLTATLSMVVWLLVSERLGRGGRVALGAVLLALTGVAAFLRIAEGGHFLSDALFATLFSALLTLALWKLTDAASAARQLNARALGADLASPFKAFRK